MNLENISPESLSRSTFATPVTLRLRGMNLCSYKNHKRAIYSPKKNRTFLITDPDIKKRIQAIVDSFVLQLRAASQADTGSISTESLRQFLMRSLPHDDCWTAITELKITGQLVEGQSEAGADILIERIDKPKPSQLLLDASKP
jgi:hypothetical protein